MGRGPGAAGPAPQAGCQGAEGGWMGPWGALDDGWVFSGTARGPCSYCCSLCLLVGAQPCAPGAAIPWEGRRDRCPQQVVCLGRGCLIPKGACQHAAAKSGSPASRQGSREGLAESQPPALSVPRCSRSGGVGLEERGQHVPPLGTACAWAWQLLSSPRWPGSPRLCRYQPAAGWPLSITAEGERSVSLTGHHHASWARTTRRGRRPSGRW